ncbi:MAG: helix-turn-helix domain-containing protein [Caulobacteraceae bacterium]
MESSEKKLKFIELRAQGLSYREIEKNLGISRATCSKWNAELKHSIADLKKEKLEELYNNYFMLKGARIKQLGETLKKICKAIEDKDLSDLSADKLLDLKLKYMNELKEEFIDVSPDKSMQEIDSKDITRELVGLLERIREGEISPTQSNREINVLNNILKAYEATTLEKKLDEIKALLTKR